MYGKGGRQSPDCWNMMGNNSRIWLSRRKFVDEKCLNIGDAERGNANCELGPFHHFDGC